MIEINQFHPSVRAGDAIGDHMWQIREILQEWGYKTEIFCEYFNSTGWIGKGGKNYKKYLKRTAPDNIMLAHYSIGSQIFKNIMQTQDKKILVYHNITPPEFFKGVSEMTSLLTSKGYSDLPGFADKVALAVGDSEYNRLELIKNKYINTDVLPIVFNPKKYEIDPDQSILQKFNDGWTNCIYVSRISPNKKHEDVIKTFYYYKKINPKSRLFLVGGYDGMEVYYNALKKLITELKLQDIHFTGHIPLKKLIAYYKVSDVFLGMSAHEGFGVPYLECMHFKVPIIAYNCTATPYTLNDSGVLVNRKDYLAIAEMISLLDEDKALRHMIIDKQSERLGDFSYKKVKHRLREIIDKVEKSGKIITQTAN